jgi:hypothetical protein
MRPSCGPCRLNTRICHYDVEPGITRGMSLKRKHDAVQTDLSQMRRIYEAIRTSSQAEANYIMQQIRQSLDPAEVLQTLSLSGRDLDNAPSPERITTQGATSSHHETPSSTASWLKGSDQNELRLNVRSEQKSYPHLSVSHKVLLWPEVFRQIHDSGITEALTELRYVSMLGTPWLLEKDTSKHLRNLPCDAGLECLAMNAESVFFPSLTVQKACEYSVAYFSTFNTMFPLLVMDDFMNNIVAGVLRHGYRDDDPESIIALLVFALGQLAIGGAFGPTTGMESGTNGSVRGDTANRPSGLEIFNEARRRTGMIATQPCLLNVQIMLLQATYFEACARHADFWSSVSAASTACKYLIRGQPMDWSSVQGDLVKRAYWICVLQERLLDIDLKIACTGIEDLEDQVPLPHFHEYVPKRKGVDGSLPGTGQLNNADELVDYAYHFSALVALSRLLRRAEDVIHGCEHFVRRHEPLWQEARSQNHSGAVADVIDAASYKEPPSHLIEELIRQLQSWRAALPRRLQWSDRDKFDFTTTREPNLSSRQSIWNQLSPLGSGFDIKMAVAQLRTRFYHAQFLIYRPFVYKALHFPELTTADDRVKCGYAMRTSCTWSLFLSPPSHRKHLVPHLFAWTQNFMVMLCIIRLCQRDGFMTEICNDSGLTSEEIQSSSSLMTEWLEDVRWVDGIADWSIRILGPLL